MAVVSMSYLLEAGVHFGHQMKRWNPKMKEYIFTSRDDIYIIDLEKTRALLEEAYAELKTIAENGGKILFVGTKKQAQEVCVEEALRSNSFYVTERWLGGTLTNFRTIRRRVKRLEDIEKMETDGTFEALPKKEVIQIKKEYEKLNRVLCGIRAMDKLPQALIIVDPKKEYNAIKEARKLHIPVFGVVDTNCDPDDVDFVIPGNDDAVRSIKVMLGVLNNAVCEATNLEVVDYVTEDEKTAKADSKSMEELIKNETVTEKEADIEADRKEHGKKYGKKKESKPEHKEVKKEEKTEEVAEEKTAEVKEEKPAKKEKVEKKEVKEDLTKKTLAELKEMAKAKELKGYSTLKKDELIALLNK